MKTAFSGWLFGFPIESQTDQKRCLHFAHKSRGERADALFQAAFIQRADLFQQNDGIPRKPEIRCRKFDMRGQFRLVDLARYRGGDDRGGILVADIVLHDENRAHSALLAADDGAQVRIVKFSTFNHSISQTLADPLFTEYVISVCGVNSIIARYLRFIPSFALQPAFFGVK